MSRGGWRAELEAALGPSARIESIAGGDINEAWRVDLSDGRRVFVKSHAAPPPGLYAAEAAGLAWLADGPLRVPGVVAVGRHYLALEWLALSARERGRGFDEQLGRGLAALHALGALPQDNTATAELPAFWIDRRLRPVIARLGDRGAVARFERQLAQLATSPERFGPPEPPARLHGDLWWGNVGACAGAPVIFDPAVYGGHREIDLAMLALFGGLGDALLGAYQERLPLADGWRDRIELWQLYPIAVHAVLFGGGYVQQLARGLDAMTEDR
jgi:fructosamine-3-kinase